MHIEIALNQLVSTLAILVHHQPIATGNEVTRLLRHECLDGPLVRVRTAHRYFRQSLLEIAQEHHALFQTSPIARVHHGQRRAAAAQLEHALASGHGVNGDDKLDIVVSGFGTIAGLQLPNGTVSLYTQGSDVTQWSKQAIVADTAGYKFPNTTSLHDIDGDNDLDVVLPVGFLPCSAIPGGTPCGALLWFEQDGGNWIEHTLVPNGNELFYHHAEIVDFDGDGIVDLVTVAEKAAGMLPPSPSKAEVQWFKGTASGDRFETTPRVLGEGLGSVPTVTDIDGDGDLDIASAEFFHEGGSFAWFERTEDPSQSNPSGTFVRHVINDDSGPSIELKIVPDLYGDGITRAVGSNHTNTAKQPPDAQQEALFVFDIPSDPTQPWPKTQISTGIQSVPGSPFAPQGAPGIFDVGDVDGDGDKDIIASGDGDPRVFWLEQTPMGWFTRVLQENLAQAGGLAIVDLDGDGKNEIVVTGYEANAAYVYVRD